MSIADEERAAFERYMSSDVGPADLKRSPDGKCYESIWTRGAWFGWVAQTLRIDALQDALAAATERAEAAEARADALQRIVADFAEATGWMVCEYPPAGDIECERCGKANRQIYYRRTSVDVDEGDSWCAECMCAEPIDNMVSAMQQADALAARLAEVEDREHPA